MDLCWALGTCLFMVSTIHGSVLGSGYLSVYGEYHPWICIGLWVPIILQDFCRKLHANERNWTGMKGTSLAPLGSANANVLWTYFLFC